MTNFTVKNHFKAENAKLVDATTYKDENGTWYVELLYEYEDESGVHCGKLPPEEFGSDRFGRCELTIGLITNEVAVFRGNFCNPMSGQIVHDVCVIDNLVKPAVHNMTIEEIEKELGYKVKIINKEKPSNTQT